MRYDCRTAWNETKIKLRPVNTEGSVLFQFYFTRSSRFKPAMKEAEVTLSNFDVVTIGARTLTKFS